MTGSVNEDQKSWLVRIQVQSRRMTDPVNNFLDLSKIEAGAERKDPNGIVLWVKDTGAGISREEIGKLFQKYKQTKAGRDSRQKGTGLGLVICKMIAEAHGGDISVASEPGKGSTFTVTLPL